MPESMCGFPQLPWASQGADEIAWIIPRNGVFWPTLEFGIGARKHNSKVVQD